MSKNSNDNACGPAEDENTVVHRMADVRAKKEATPIYTKSAKQLNKIERKCLSKLTIRLLFEVKHLHIKGVKS